MDILSNVQPYPSYFDPGIRRWSTPGEDDILLKASPLLAIIPNWAELLSVDLMEEEREKLRSHERTGRPLGSDDFLTMLEKLTSPTLTRQKPGPKKKQLNMVSLEFFII